MSDNLEVTILRKQNTELAARIDTYRRENKDLTRKNEELNTWTVNLACVLSSIEAAFKVFMANENSLYELIKPKGNKEATAIVAKCVNHFKHFNQILTNLSKKICSEDRSNQFTQEAKQGINSLVSAYEIFFKEFLKQYFAFNQKYEEWLKQILGSQELRGWMREMALKEQQNRDSIKEFSLYFNQLRGKFPAYSAENQKMLLGDQLKNKTEQVQSLTQRNNVLSRRFRLLMDYNQSAVNLSLCQLQNHGCICGGVQLVYAKEKWEKMEVIKAQQKDLTVSQQVIDTEEMTILKNQVELLLRQNTTYLERIQQLKIQKNIEQSIFKSHAYSTLLDQSQELIKYCGSLQKKLRDYQETLPELEKARCREMSDLRMKYESDKHVLPVVDSVGKSIRPMIHDFCQNITSIFKPIIAILQQNKNTQQSSLQRAKSIRESILKVKQQNDQIFRKYNQYMLRQAKGNQPQFRHESHKKMIKEVETYLPREENGIAAKLLEYAKSRQRKIDYYEKQIKKLEKEIGFKSTFLDKMKENNLMNEEQFLAVSNKNTELKKAVGRLEEETKKIMKESLESRSLGEKEKSLLELKLRSQSEINSKHQQRTKLLLAKIDQLSTYPAIYNEYVRNHQLGLEDMRQRLSSLQDQHQEVQTQCNMAKAKLNEFQRSEKNYIQENEKLRSRLNATKKVEARKQQELTDEENHKLAERELTDLRSKFYCSCQKQRPVEVSLKTCPHLFCKPCVQDLLKARARNCPLCREKFSKADVNPIKWN